MKGEGLQDSSVRTNKVSSEDTIIINRHRLVAGLVVLVILCGIGVLYFLTILPVAEESSAPVIVDIDTANVGSEISAGTNNKTEDLPDTNPFEASSNPFDEYKNPFDN